MLMLGAMFVWGVSLVPIYAVLTVFIPRHTWVKRLVVSMVFSTIALFVVIGISMVHHNGTVMGLYTASMLAASVAAAAALILRKVILLLFRRNDLPMS